MINSPEYLKPIIILVTWTFVILLMIPFARFNAAAKGIVRASDFKMGESENVPDKVRLPNRNLMNLLEMPILFYVASIILALGNDNSKSSLVLAWAYVGMRILHSLIHIGKNNVLIRLILFALSNFILSFIWIQIGIKYM